MNLRTTVLAFLCTATLLTSGAVALGSPAYASGGYEIFNRGSRKCLTVPNASTALNAEIVQEACDDNPGQHWAFVADFQGDDEIENLDTGRCAAYSSLANGAPLIQTLCGFVVGSEFWRLSHLGTDGAYQMYSFRVSLSNYCMDLENGSTSDGVPIQVWTCNPNTNNQKWDLYAT